MASKNEKDSKDKTESDPSGIEIAIESLRDFFAKKAEITDEEEVPEILGENTFEAAIKYILENDCKKIITMAGAGISTSAGIPDFRSPKTGLYHNLEKYDLPHPQAIFELDFFHKNPKPFFVLAKELFPGKFKPTPCHYFIKLLNDKGKLLRHFTQNIDTLERVAGIPEDKIVEAHGTFHTGHCVSCKQKYSLEWMKERIFKDEIPKCETCSGVVKPDIVFFGENLPRRFFNLIESDFKECDFLIILGSSLAVQPFASLIDRVPKTCPRLLINREKVGEKSNIMSLIGMRSGLDFSKTAKQKRDVCWLGDCDDGCLLLAEKLGWGEELNKIIEEEHEKIDKESNKENINVKN